MIDMALLKREMCSAFCGGISINKVTAGYAVSTLFTDNNGDRLSFYIVQNEDGFRIEDDGSYLSHLVARDISIDKGNRAEALDQTLAAGNAFWDRDTYEIKSQPFAETSLPENMIKFTASLIQVRSLELLTKERIRSTFREEALTAIVRSFGTNVAVNENEPVDSDLSEFPSDAVIRPVQPSENSKTAAVYFVSNSEKLADALLLQQELMLMNRSDVAVVALIEDAEMSQISRRKFQRAQNRSVIMPIFRGDEKASMQMIGRQISVRLAAAS